MINPFTDDDTELMVNAISNIKNNKKPIVLLLFVLVLLFKFYNYLNLETV